MARLGVEFVERAEATAGKLPVREIRGISATLTRWWSRRRIAIEARQAEIAAEFQQRFGRPPTVIESKALADQATLETRDAKHGHRSERDQRETWRAEADDVLGDPAEVDEMYAHAINRGAIGTPVTREWVEDAAAAAVTAVEESRATWNVWHLSAEAQRQARRASIARDELDAAARQVVDAAISRSVRLGVDDPITEPGLLRRPDGASVYDVHGSAAYTSAKVLSAEQQLLTLAGKKCAHALAEVRVEAAIAASAASGFELNDAQAAMVRDLATSGGVVQLALAPAGTGKTTTMSVLAEAWTSAGGQVIGLAPSAQAAHELGQAVAGHTDTLAKLVWSLANESPAERPRWVRDIGPQSMVIVDETGQAATTDLAAAIRFVADRGGVVRLVGDDQQLAAVGAGGVLRDIQRRYGASTLSEVRRFDDPAEAAVTLAVREGDPGALGFYADEGRIKVGDLNSVADQAYDAWAADRADGLDSVLLAPTREVVSQLNARARADRLAGVADRGPDVDLADGNRASAGDVVLTRRNSRRLVISRSNWVKNGDRWQVQGVLATGALRVRHLELGRTIDLPADYVAEHVQLGYATTVHGAQGITADTAHLVATGDETRQTLYVGVSRGRRANHIYLATGYDGDPHSVIDPKALRPPTALDVLEEVLRRDGSDRSATTTEREAASASTQLHDAVVRYNDAVGFAAEQVLDDNALSQIEHEIEALWPGLTSEPAYPTLRAHLAMRVLDGHDPMAVLLDAAGERELGTSTDRAAVLDWRLSRSVDDGPLPWLDAVPRLLAAHPTWGAYLDRRSEQISTLCDSVRREAEGWSPATALAWAAPFTGSGDADLRADIAVWRAAFAVAEHARRVTGPPQPGSSTAPHQERLERRARAVTGTHRASDALVAGLPDEVRGDRDFVALAERLGALQAAQVDVRGLLDQALAQPTPLPDEHAADALWWRLVRHLGPAALRASADHAHSLRPGWTDHLTQRLGSATAERVIADAMWPALVAAVHARPPEWTAEQLIDSAAGRGPDVRPEDLCSALVWRIATMTDAPFDEPEAVEPDFELPAPAPVLDVPAEAAADTSTERIVELNEMAFEHFTSSYGRSWAPAYLHDRLGTDLADDPHFAVGYAPPGPSSLIHHLTERGATVDELIDAGLARLTERGRLVDAFRDRVVFPIHEGNDLVGFIGRRNPTKGDGEYAGPKYLNTRTTAAFAKGEQLFGLTECAASLATGAVPALVEGPMDAIAVTIASRGEYVGIAPLGTAFTAAQAEKLKPYAGNDADRLVIATDPDAAGWASAQKAFWRLAALRVTARHVALPDGIDPADVLRASGANALQTRLGDAVDFGAALVDRLIERHLDDVTDAFACVDLARDAARIIGALPPDRWAALGGYLADRLDLPLDVVHEEIYEAGQLWTDEPDACAARQLGKSRSDNRAEFPRRLAAPPSPEVSISGDPSPSTIRPLRPPASYVAW